MYKAIFFDVDDTLLNFRQCSLAALLKTFGQFNIPHDSSVLELFYEIDSCLWAQQRLGLLSVQDVINLRFKELLGRLGINADSDLLKDVFQENLSTEFVLEPGALEIIRHLSTTHKLYVASNGILTMQQSRLKLAALFPYFSDLFVSDDIGYEKPDNCFFEECLRRSALESKDVLFVGDNLVADMLGASNNHIATCWYNRHGIPNNNGVTMNYTIDQLLQLKDILEK